MNETLSPTVAALRQLAANDGSGFGIAIGVVNDVGAALAEYRRIDLTELSAALGAARERLDSGAGVDRAPAEILQSDKAELYLAGALWACSDIVNAYQRSLNAERERRAQRLGRESARSVALELLHDRERVSPSEVREELARRGVVLLADTISKALSDLISDGLVEASNGPRSGDRRQRFYALRRDHSGGDQQLAAAREAVVELRGRMAEPEAAALLLEWLQSPSDWAATDNNAGAPAHPKS